MTRPWWDKRLHIITGKGGVGKTVVACSLALALKERGRRVLVAEVRAPRCVPALFGQHPESNGPLQLDEGLTWLNLTPADALRIYAMRKLRLKMLYRLVFERRLVKRFLQAMPALSEILVLGQVVDMLEDPQQPFDAVVLDAPSTGPGAMMLEAPQVVVKTAPRGPLQEGAQWISSWLSDPDRTSVHLVALPEEMAVSEAIGLGRRLQGELSLPRGRVFLNRVIEDPFPPGLGRALARMAAQEDASPLVQAALLLWTRLSHQEAHFERLRQELDLPVLVLPELLHQTPEDQQDSLCMRLASSLSRGLDAEMPS